MLITKAANAMFRLVATVVLTAVLGACGEQFTEPAQANPEPAAAVLVDTAAAGSESTSMPRLGAAVGSPAFFTWQGMNYEVRNARTETGSRVTQQWNAVAGDAQVRNLAAWVAIHSKPTNAPTHCVPVFQVNSGFTSSIDLFASSSAIAGSAGLTFRYTVMPISCNITRFPTSRAVLVVGRFDQLPGLPVARVLWRQDASWTSWEEWAWWKGQKPLKMTSKFGDHIGGHTVLGLLGEVNPTLKRTAENAVRAAGSNVFEAQRRMFDVRQWPVGQATLLGWTALATAHNWEETYADPVYVDRLVVNGLKPTSRDSKLVAQLKEQLTKALTDVVKDLFKKAISWLVGWFF